MHGDDCRRMAHSSVHLGDDGLYAPHYDPDIGRNFRQYWLLLRFKLWSDWQRISCPILIIYGAESDFVTPDLLDRMLEHQPDAKVIKVDGVGHSPTLNTPEQIASIQALLGADERSEGRPMGNKILATEDAIRLIRDGDRITTSGSVGIGVPEALLEALEARLLDTGSPKALKLVFAAAQGDGRDRGLNRLGQDGLLDEVIGGHWALVPKIGRLAVDGRIRAYNLPQGVISQQFREIAGGRPGLITRVGLHTFVDPRIDGGKINRATETDIVELIEIGGEEFLFYPARPIDVALLRGTTADPLGNVTLENKALTLDNPGQAMAVKTPGGAVIVQVERSVAPGALDPRAVQIPGALVDAIVLAEPVDHLQTFGTAFSHAFTGAFRLEADSMPATEFSTRKIIARRAAFELPVSGVVNLGIGMPEGVAAVAGEEKLLDHLTLTTEPGVIGGMPASGLDFGAAVNTDAVIPPEHSVRLL